MRHYFIVVALAISFATAAFAEDSSGIFEQSPEDFKIEASGSLWILDTGGTVHGNSSSVDLVNDLGARQNVNTFSSDFVYKPGRKHRVVVDFMSLGLSGSHQTNESFTYNNQRFSVNELIDSNASLKYLYGGYQYDFVTGPVGHFGASAGAVFLHGTGSVSAPAVGLRASQSGNAGLPLVGIDFRVFPIPGRSLIDIDGAVRGIDVGHYGYYVETHLNGGIWFGRHVGLHAGYQDIRAYFQNTSSSLTNTGRANVRLRGPVFSLLFRL